MFQAIPHRVLTEPAAGVVSTSGSATTLRVEGLICSLCAINVERRLGTVPGVTDASVDLRTGEATVHHAPDTQPQALTAAVESAVMFPSIRKLIASLAARA